LKLGFLFFGGCMNIIIYIFIGICAGMLSGLLGIGGATLIIPALIYILGFTQYQAQGTTLALMVPPIGLLAAMRYYKAGHVNLYVALFICLGFFVGGYFGADIAQHISGPILKKLFGVLFFAVSLHMMFGK
jgi:uncharacterized protein